MGKNPSEGKRVHILYNLILLKEYNIFAPLIGTSFEISESPHSNVLHQFFKVAVGNDFVNKSAKLSFEQICCTVMSPFSSRS